MSNKGIVCLHLPLIKIISQPLLCLWLGMGVREPPSTSRRVDKGRGISCCLVPHTRTCSRQSAPPDFLLIRKKRLWKKNEG